MIVSLLISGAQRSLVLPKAHSFVKHIPGLLGRVQRSQKPAGVFHLLTYASTDSDVVLRLQRHIHGHLCPNTGACLRPMRSTEITVVAVLVTPRMHIVRASMRTAR